jgi:OmpA-OmpF porin, OOP family
VAPPKKGVITQKKEKLMSFNKTVLALVLASAALPTLAAEGGAGFIRAEAGRTDLEVAGAKGDDTGYNLRGGYFFTPNFGVEGFYARYGSDSDGDVRVKADGFGAGVIGKTNFGEAAYSGFFVSGRAGVARSKLDVRVSGVGSASDTDTNFYAGIGVGYDFSRNFGLSLNYDYQKPKVFDTRFKVETTTLGVEYRF